MQRLKGKEAVEEACERFPEIMLQREVDSLSVMLRTSDLNQEMEKHLKVLSDVV